VPERNQELPCHRGDRNPTGSTFQFADPLAEPGREFASRLIVQPQPGRLDQCFARSSVACATDTPVFVYIAALMGHGRKAYIARELLSISEVTVEDLARKHGCEVVADAINPA
jgi:hypothetical protein